MISNNKKYADRERRKKEMAITNEKPNKNRIFCPDCAKPKMLFESEAKALNFIRWNGDKLETDGKPLRAYYCPACCGWHITHQEYRETYNERTAGLLFAYNHAVRHKKEKIDHLILNDGSTNKLSARQIFQELPEDIQKTPYKSAIRKGLTRYFSEKSIEDPRGELRGEIYQIWKHYNEQRKADCARSYLQ